MGFWKKVFGGDAKRLLERADSFAREEFWPEALAALDRARGTLDETDRATGEEIEKRRAEYTRAYRTQLAEAIPRLAREGEDLQAEELLSVAETLCESDDERKAIRESMWGAKAGRKEAERDLVREEKEREPEPDFYGGRSENDIDVLAHAFADPLEPEEREAIFGRPPHFRLGFVLWNEERFAEAKMALQRFLESSPYDPYGLLYMGLTVGHLGEREEAVRRIEDAIKYEPSLVLASLALARIKGDEGQYEQAGELLETLFGILDAYPDQFGRRRREEVYVAALDMLIAAEKWERAEEMYDDLRERELLDERLDIEVRLAGARGDGDETARLFRLWLTSSPHGSARHPTPRDFETAGDFFMGYGDAEEALHWYSQAGLQLAELMRDLTDPETIEDLLRTRVKTAHALVELDRADEALTIAEEMERLEPRPPHAAEIRKLVGN